MSRAGHPDRELMGLADEIDALRIWFAAYAGDGMVLTPEVVRAIVGELTRLMDLARDCEDAASEARQAEIAARADRLLAALDRDDPSIVIFPGPRR